MVARIFWNPKSNRAQIEMIKKHLNLVFIHEIDPSIDVQHDKETVDKMNKIHNKPTLLLTKQESVMRC